VAQSLSGYQLNVMAMCFLTVDPAVRVKKASHTPLPSRSDSWLSSESDVEEERSKSHAQETQANPVFTWCSQEPPTTLLFSLLVAAQLAKQGQHVKAWRDGRRILVLTSDKFMRFEKARCRSVSSP